MNQDEPTIVDRILSRLVNHPWVAVIIVIGVIVVALGAFTGAIQDITEFVRSLNPESSTTVEDSAKGANIERGDLSGLVACGGSIAALENSFEVLFSTDGSEIRVYSLGGYGAKEEALAKVSFDRLKEREWFSVNMLVDGIDYRLEAQPVRRSGRDCVRLRVVTREGILLP